MISDEKLKKIMDGIENRVRHAYNCGWNDGFGAMKEKITKDIQERIGESIDKALEQESKHYGCSGCRHAGEVGYPCDACQRIFNDYWEPWLQKEKTRKEETDDKDRNDKHGD